MPTDILPDRRSYSDRTSLICAKLAAWSYINFDTDEGLKLLDKKLKKEGLVRKGIVRKEKKSRLNKRTGLIK